MEEEKTDEEDIKKTDKNDIVIPIRYSCVYCAITIYINGKYSGLVRLGPLYFEHQILACCYQCQAQNFGISEKITNAICR